MPVMLRSNYSKSLATGTIAASGTLGQIIPPSIVLIILADQLSSATDQASILRMAEFKQATGQIFMPSEFGLTSTSAGDMFLGALLPGLVLVGFYMVYILILALVRPHSAPPVPFEGAFDMKFAVRVFLALVPPLTLIFAVLGSIIMGVATVNQAGAIGAMIMAGYRLVDGRRGAYTPALLAILSIGALAVLLSIFDINVKSIHGGADWLAVALAGIAVAVLLIAILWSGWRAYRIDETLQGVMIETAKTTSLVFIILLGAAMLTAAFRAFGGEDLVRNFLGDLPGGFITKFIVVMVVIFVLGFFLDFIEIAVVVVPIVAPILLADTTANVTAVWLGVMIGVNMQTSFLTPPFGFALFYLRGVAPPEVKTIQMYAGVVPFILLQLGGLAIVGLFPSLVNYLPNRVSLTSETAPPPKNPRLQLCIEEFLFEQFDVRANEIRKSIGAARALDISYLPEPRRRTLTESVASAEATFGLIAKVRAAEKAVEQGKGAYRPIHREVRRLQVRIHKHDAKLEELKTELRRLPPDRAADEENVRNRKRHIAELERDKQSLMAQIPASWSETGNRYRTLSTAVRRARLTYR
jgi:TRAP-type mannitol/chloroaromatic compound transport system permease large subunit